MIVEDLSALYRKTFDDHGGSGARGVISHRSVRRGRVLDRAPRQALCSCPAARGGPAGV